MTGRLTAPLREVDAPGDILEEITSPEPSAVTGDDAGLLLVARRHHIDSDTQVGTDAVGVLAAAGTNAESIDLTAPATAGTYYYGIISYGLASP